MITFGEARSALYESMKREAKKKERKKKWEPYVRKTVPSMFSFASLHGMKDEQCLRCDRTNLSAKPSSSTRSLESSFRPDTFYREKRAPSW